MANAKHVTRYRGCRPNSSLKAAVNRGVMANPRVYIERPIVAWKWVQFKSRIMSGIPRLYDAALAPANSVTIECE